MEIHIGPDGRYSVNQHYPHHHLDLEVKITDLEISYKSPIFCL